MAYEIGSKLHSSGGGTGLDRELSEHTMFVFSYSHLNEIVDLVNVVIVRSACPIRELKPCSPVPTARIRQLMKSHPGSGGGGATCGPHNVHIDRTRQLVWLDAVREIPFDGYNILMLDDIQACCNDVAIAGREQTHIDISRERMLRLAPMHERATERKIAERLSQLSSVRDFCA